METVNGGKLSLVTVTFYLGIFPSQHFQFRITGQSQASKQIVISGNENRDGTSTHFVYSAELVK